MSRAPWKKGRVVAAAIAICALAAAGAIYAATSGGKKKAEAKEETTSVEKRVVDDVIEVSGHLKPRVEQEIRAPAEGIVEEVTAAAGARLKAGDPIARLDSTQADFAIDQTKYQIEQETFSGNKRKVEMLERELAAKERAASDLAIRAHFDGVVSSLDLKPGDVVKAGEKYGRLIDVSSLVADVEIAEMDIPRARPGLPAEFRFPAIPGLVARGRIETFPAEARINASGLAVLDAKLVIDSPPKGLLPAYSFNAVIKAGEPREILVADSRAVTYKAGKPHVERRKADGQWETVAVETEGFGFGFVRVVSGCAEGDVLRLPAKKAGEDR
jgi:multidrug efflux pump subunit AcrA (membrane-fusion protein)